ncbi:ribosomal large subunit pseudouridine synthase B [Sulfurirhabdus autotrophica]|uniref:Pseudouridine synthase n=1 Tax=Sulfurirhabdus autotrophica TaxID=1706046 RepID=A0A4R3YCG0_9PROT|nr:ribosomal large subunit pseudouridine synthase B [Sulfurirhabdus autotrophica]
MNSNGNKSRGGSSQKRNKPADSSRKPKPRGSTRGSISGRTLNPTKQSSSVDDKVVRHAPKAAVVADDSHKLQKMLAQAGMGSRREMEEVIKAGRVTINGKVAETGDRVGPEDVVRVDKRPVKLQFAGENTRILLYHKQEGEIVSRDDPEGRTDVFEKLPRIRGGKWISVGRLDFNTSGLLVFTTSGELANRLMHPRFEVQRQYAVRILGELTDEQMKLLRTGIELEDGLAKFDELADQGGEGSNHWYHVVLREGRNREVRRMFESIGLTVSRLMRVRFGIINMPPRLKRGQWLELEPKQVAQVMKWADTLIPHHDIDSAVD